MPSDWANAFAAADARAVENVSLASINEDSSPIVRLVHSTVFDALRAGLSDEEILELTYIVSMYVMQSVMSKALRTEYDDRDDPIVEIPAPGDDQTFRT